MIGDPDRIEATAVDLADQRLQLVDFRQPRPDGRLGAPVDRLNANLQMGIERQVHGSLLAGDMAQSYLRQPMFAGLSSPAA